MRSTENTNLATVVPKSDQKLTEKQQQAWATVALAKTRQTLKEKSVNTIVFKDPKEQK